MVIRLRHIQFSDEAGRIIRLLVTPRTPGVTSARTWTAFFYDEIDNAPQADSSVLDGDAEQRRPCPGRLIQFRHHLAANGAIIGSRLRDLVFQAGEPLQQVGAARRSPRSFHP